MREARHYGDGKQEFHYSSWKDGEMYGAMSICCEGFEFFFEMASHKYVQP